MKTPKRYTAGSASLFLLSVLFLFLFLALLNSSLGFQAQDSEGRVLRSWDLLQSVFSVEAIHSWQSQENAEGGLGLTLHLPPQAASSLLVSLAILAAALLFALPLGIGTALYLGYFASKSKLRNIAGGMLNFVADLPPLVFGLVVFGIFSQLGGEAAAPAWAWVSATVVVALYLLPAVVRAVETGIAAVPQMVWLSGLALGVGTWALLRDRVLPEARQAIAAGILAACSRVFGDAAVIILIGSAIQTLPVEIYEQAVQGSFTAVGNFTALGAAASSALLLLLVMFFLRLSARIMRKKDSGVQNSKPSYKQGIPGWI